MPSSSSTTTTASTTTSDESWTEKPTRRHAKEEKDEAATKSNKRKYSRKPIEVKEDEVKRKKSKKEKVPKDEKEPRKYSDTTRLKRFLVKHELTSDEFFDMIESLAKSKFKEVKRGTGQSSIEDYMVIRYVDGEARPVEGPLKRHVHAYFHK